MNDVLIGTWAEIPTPYATHILSKAGLDFVIIDMEHGIIGFEQAQNMIFAAHSVKKAAYIRVPVIEEAWILRALDTGCDGIVFPQVSGIKDIEEIIRLSYFTPKGERGFNPYITAGGYAGGKKDYFETENARIKIAVILEGKEAFDHLDTILKYEEIDIIYIGQYDLSIALGVPGEVTHPLVLEKMRSAVSEICRSGKMAGCMVHSVNEAKEYIEQGFHFIVYKVDTGILFESVKGFVEGVKEDEII